MVGTQNQFFFPQYFCDPEPHNLTEVSTNLKTASKRSNLRRKPAKELRRPKILRLD